MFLSCPCTCVCMCMCVLAWQRYPPTRLPLTSSLASIMCIVPSQCCATDVAALDAGSCVLPLSLQTTIPLVKLQLFIFYLFFAVSYGGVWTIICPVIQSEWNTSRTLVAAVIYVQRMATAYQLAKLAIKTGRTAVMFVLLFAAFVKIPSAVCKARECLFTNGHRTRVTCTSSLKSSFLQTTLSILQR